MQSKKDSEEFHKGDKVYYGSWSRARTPKGEFIIAKGVIIEIDRKKGFAIVKRTDYTFIPNQHVELRRLKKEKSNEEKEPNLF